MTLSASQLERLRGLRLMPRHARPSRATGERRSKTLGVGLEFVEHRPYREGDDVRHLDQRLMARLGQPFIRQFAADQKLPVGIILDSSPSMVWGGGEKLRQAKQAAEMLAAVAMMSGDLVRVCLERGFWSPGFSGPQHLEPLAGWLAKEVSGQSQSFGKEMTLAGRGLSPKSLVVLISDWLDADASQSLELFGQMGHEPVVIQIASPHELDPTGLVDGTVTLVDAELGDEITLALDSKAVEDYRAAFDAHKAHLQQAAAAGHGQHILLSTEASPADLLLTFQHSGLIASK